MAITSGIRTSGGKRLEAVLKKAEAARKTKVKVGFFADKKYDDKNQTPVAVVAAIQEFGLGGGGIPERPFFRQSIAQLEDELPKKLAGVIDPETMTVDAVAAARIGAYAVEVVKDRISDLQDPPNAESTILQKGSDSPLQETNKMLNSVDYETE